MTTTTVPSSPAAYIRTKLLAQALTGIATLGLWEAASTWLIDPFWIGKPSEIGARLWETFVHGDMLTHTGITLAHSVIGLLPPIASRA